MLLALFIPVVMLLVLAVVAWRGGSPRVGACASCGYDMRRARSLRCPECGHEHALAADMRFVPRMKWRARGCFVAAIVILVGAIVSGYHWTSFVPRPLMVVLLDSFVEAPAPAPGGTLPAPNRTYMYSGDPWERLVWQQQVARAIDAWAALAVVPRRGATLAEVEALLPAAEEMEKLFDQAGGTLSAESWPGRRAIRRLQEAAARARAAAGPAAAGEIEFDRGAWALSELQYEGADYTFRADWASPPAPLLVALLESGKPGLQHFALKRLGRYQDDLPGVMKAVRAVAEGSPDTGVRNEAGALVEWMEAFGPDGGRARLRGSTPNTPGR